MLSALLITLREGLEAALIIGILFGYLRQVKRLDRAPYVSIGVALAVLLSAIAAITMRTIGAELAEPYEQIFEGTTMLLAVAILTWMIFWMRYQGRFMKSDLEKSAQAAMTRNENWGLLGLAFFSVFREGIETALFLAANAFAADAQGTLIGALVGIAVAVVIGVLIYVFAVRLNVRLFFDVTSILLIVFAAGLITHSVHEFQEIGWLPILTNIAWSTESLMSNDSIIGSILRSLIGYNAEPSILEVLTYIGYLVIIVQGIRWWTQKLSFRLTQKTT